MNQEQGENQYDQEFTDSAFWDKLKNFALKAGEELIMMALKLYYALMDSNTPSWAKMVITSALGYFILPTDAIPDMIPGVGFADDLGALIAAVSTVAAYIKPEHVQKAKDQLKRWFGSNTDSK